jgi:phosphate uptake regulator
MAPLFDWLRSERASSVQLAVDDLRDMLRIGEEMFATACANLLDNEILEVDLDVRDDEVDAREAHLRHEALEYLSSSPGRQMPYVLKILGIVQEAERIGDLAKSIADTARLADGPRMAPTVLPIRALRDRVLEAFAETRASFVEHDQARAEGVLKRHDDIKRDANAAIADLAREGHAPTNEAVVLALGARMIGRTSSHLANIASIVVFPYEQIRRSHLDDDT